MAKNEDVRLWGARFSDGPSEALAALYEAADGYPYFVQAYGKVTWDVAAASPVTAVATAATMPAALSRPAGSIPRPGAGSRSSRSSTVTPVHSPTGRSLSAGCSGCPIHRPP